MLKRFLTKWLYSTYYICSEVTFLKAIIKIRNNGGWGLESLVNKHPPVEKCAYLANRFTASRHALTPNSRNCAKHVTEYHFIVKVWIYFLWQMHFFNFKNNSIFDCELKNFHFVIFLFFSFTSSTQNKMIVDIAVLYLRPLASIILPFWMLTLTSFGDEIIYPCLFYIDDHSYFM